MVVINRSAVFLGHCHVQLVSVHYGGDNIVLAVYFFCKAERFFIESASKIIAAVLLKILGVDIHNHLVKDLRIGFQAFQRYRSCGNHLVEIFVIGQLTATLKANVHRST